MASWRRRYAGVPERLARFYAPDWPGAECPHDALRQWENACADWLAEDSCHTPRPGAPAEFNRWWCAGDSNRSLPFGEFGDAIDVLREAVRIGHAMPACPHEYRPATRGGQ